ncbi:MAG: response regulator transcription factor [Fusobacteriaceae bacterium]
MKVLIVEDDLEIQNLIEYFFLKEGYETDKSMDGMEALKKIQNTKYSLIILDLMLPSIDGKIITKLVKDMPEIYGTPKIIMVTAKTEIEDVLDGLELGADDYLKKPFDPRELVMRGKKLLNLPLLDSSENKKDEKKYSFMNLTIDEQKFLVKKDGKEIEFSKKEFDLLLMLVINKGIVINREKILDEVWSTNYSIGDRTVDVYIGKIREKLEELGKYIKTVKGVGYKLEEKKELP